MNRYQFNWSVEGSLRQRRLKHSRSDNKLELVDGYTDRLEDGDEQASVVVNSVADQLEGCLSCVEEGVEVWGARSKAIVKQAHRGASSEEGTDLQEGP